MAELDIEVYDPIPPTSLKKFATGQGTASKERMTVAAQREWPGVDFPTDDAVDAAWLAALARALHDDIPVTSSQLSAIRGIRDSRTKQVFRLNKRTNI
jgi:crossover junction endodeoxyribonuclease RuvC